MYKRILVPYDGSKYARKALEIACSLALEYGSSIRVLYVVDASHAWVLVGGIEFTLKEKLEEQGKKLLEEARRIAEEKGVNVETKLRIGHPSNDIIEEAQEWKADLIILGAKGVSALHRLILGSVAEAVVHNAPCDILLVKKAG